MTNIELNEAISDGSIGELIQVAEARQRKTLSKVADDICAHPGVRLVLVSGGSAAGKTTTAKRLCTQLRVNDRFALHISTDDYFVGDDRTPRLCSEHGESLGARSCGRSSPESRRAQDSCWTPKGCCCWGGR